MVFILSFQHLPNFLQIISFFKKVHLETKRWAGMVAQYSQHSGG
jgi:hypothetical protein